MSIFPKKKTKEAASHAELLEARKNVLSSRSEFYLREAYKTLRTNVSFALAGAEDGGKVIVVTSPNQGEGKSITSINLAISYAMTERRVLIIDCDLRRPKLARLLQIKSKNGLSNLLVDPSLRQDVILKSGTPNLDVLLSGSIPPNPSELLGSPRMQALIEELRGSYDFIILDSPPVNVVTDASVLSPMSNGVLLLVRADRSERGEVAHALSQLEYAQARILGVVLNGVGQEGVQYGRSRYGYRRYGRYGYGKYGYGKYGYSKYGYSSGYGYSASVAHNSSQEDPEAERGTADA